jgi:hypothetical protein
MLKMQEFSSESNKRGHVFLPRSTGYLRNSYGLGRPYGIEFHAHTHEEVMRVVVCTATAAMATWPALLGFLGFFRSHRHHRRHSRVRKRRRRRWSRSHCSQSRVAAAQKCYLAVGCHFTSRFIALEMRLTSQVSMYFQLRDHFGCLANISNPAPGRIVLHVNESGPLVDPTLA